MNEYFGLISAGFSAVVALLIVASLVKISMNKKKYNRLPEEFEDHPAYHGDQSIHYIYSMYVFTEYTGLTRMTLHFEHFPTLDDIFRAINKKYGDEKNETFDCFRKIIWNLGLPEKPNDYDSSEVSLGKNRIVIYKDPIVEN